MGWASWIADAGSCDKPLVTSWFPVLYAWYAPMSSGAAASMNDAARFVRTLSQHGAAYARRGGTRAVRLHPRRERPVDLEECGRRVEAHEARAGIEGECGRRLELRLGRIEQR